jgi:hypothetical protein
MHCLCVKKDKLMHRPKNVEKTEFWYLLQIDGSAELVLPVGVAAADVAEHVLQLLLARLDDLGPISRIRFGRNLQA